MLSINRLIVEIKSGEKTWLGVNGFSFHINKNETVCITGESGAGKSLSVLSILGLLPQNAHIVEGEIHFNGVNLRRSTTQQLREILGKEIGVVFQDPGSSLNPVMKIGEQLGEIFRRKEKYNKKEALQASISLLEKVGFQKPLQVSKQFPYQLSGGMQQRILLAMAISRKPKLLIADEPTTALDATTQAQIVELIQQLKQDFDLTVLWITHDLSLASRIADRTVIMYAGKTMESAPTQKILQKPFHPYTIGLLQSMPQYALQNHCPLQPIKGATQTRSNANQCVFYTRCPKARAYCKMAQPPIRQIDTQHTAACWLHENQVAI
jgi:oligopeptide/dipeptide ABC transporter ATP-binding protein